MNELLIKYFEGNITSDEKDALFETIEESPELKKEFISFQNIRGLTSWLVCKGDEELAIGKLLEFKQSQRKKLHAVLFRKFLSYAATICITVATTLSVLYFIQKDKVKVQSPIAYQELTTPRGQRIMFKMQDGTKVWLNACTTLRYPCVFNDSIRKVELDGEAYFEVKHNAKIPFIVVTHKAMVKVLGTKFNVFAYKNSKEFKVSLVDGCVNVRANNTSMNMTILPYEALSLLDGKFIKESFADTDFLLWKEGIYAFDDLPFNKIVEKLELYYGVRLVQKNKKLAHYKFSGKFRQRDGIESVLRTLQQVHRFSYKKINDLDKIIIY